MAPEIGRVNRYENNSVFGGIDNIMDSASNIFNTTRAPLDQYKKALGIKRLDDGTLQGTGTNARIFTDEKDFEDYYESLNNSEVSSMMRGEDLSTGGIFDKGNVFGQGGSVQSVMNLAGGALQLGSMFDQKDYNKKLSKNADLTNYNTLLSINENQRRAGSQDKFDAGWNIG